MTAVSEKGGGNIWASRAFLLQFSCWPVIWFYLMLMSTGCLAPLAHMVIPGSQYSNFTRNIFIVVIYFWARVSTNKDCCCCCCCCYKCTFYMFYRMIIWTQGSKKWICFSVIQFSLPWRTFTPWWFKQNWLSTHFVYYYFFSQYPQNVCHLSEIRLRS